MNIARVLLLTFCVAQLNAVIPKLLIKIPTRARPERFFKTLDAYYHNLSELVPTHFLISCDIDDATMCNAQA
jgi:hypothetical protein